MGFLSNLFFGTSDAAPLDSANGDAELPKQVQEWNEQTPRPQNAAFSAKPEGQNVRASTPEPVAKPASPRKIIPELDCTNVEANLSSDGKTLELWLTLKNRTPNEIEIRNITILNQRYSMNQFYKPSESREIKVFSGAAPLDYHMTKAIVQMKVVENDDYFEAEFVVEFHRESYHERTVWVPEELKPVRPIRDI